MARPSCGGFANHPPARGVRSCCALIAATEPTLQYRIIPDLVSRRVRETPAGIAFSGLDENDAWQPVTWFLYCERVGRIAAALRAVGLGRGHRAAILAPTSMDWQYTQMACLVR